MKVRWIRAVLAGLLVFLSTTSDLCADPLDRWTWLYPNPQGVTLRAVTYGNGLFVAVGDLGTVVTSSNGFDWSLQTYGKSPSLNGVGHANGVFVAVGDSGTILTSSNGVDWITRVSGTTNKLRSVAGNSAFVSNHTAQFLAVGDFGAAVVCTNISTWTGSISGTANTLNAVALADGFFAAVGSRGTLLFTDGSSWFPGDSGTTNSLNSFVSGNGVYAAGGDLGIFLPNGEIANAILYSTSAFTNWKRHIFSGTVASAYTRLLVSKRSVRP